MKSASIFLTERFRKPNGKLAVFNWEEDTKHIVLSAEQFGKNKWSSFFWNELKNVSFNDKIIEFDLAPHESAGLALE